jgi:hypothetical protein
MALLLSAGCAASGEKTIRVEPPPQATQTTARAIATVLLENGFRHVGLKDPLTGNYLQTVELHGEYRMAFAAEEDEGIRVFVRVKEDSGKVILRFYEEERSELSPQAEGTLRTLTDRLALEFGEKNVKVR